MNLDLFTVVIDWPSIQDLQLAYFKSGVPHIDTPQDHAFFATMYKFASEHGVKNILTGANYSTESVRNPIEWMYYQSDSTQLKDIHRKHGKRSISKFPITNILWHKIYLKYIRGIKVISPLNYFPYRKDDAMSKLTKKFGWEPYPQKHFESRFTKFYESYWLFERFRFDTRKVQLSSLILSEQIDREDALKILQDLPYDKETIINDFGFIANKLDIDVGELKEYMSMPLKSYKDYKSQDSIYRIGAKLMRLFSQELGGKR